MYMAVFKVIVIIIIILLIYIAPLYAELQRYGSASLNVAEHRCL